MLDASSLLMFILAGWLLNLTPGPDVLYIVRHAVRQGVRAGMVAALGIVSGCFVHVLAAALGVGALLAASATAFTVLKWVGAAYLVWMGVKLLLARSGMSPMLAAPTAENAVAPEAQPLSHIWRQGFLTNVLNPKVALFFLAFVPQFIDPHSEHKLLAFVLLGLIFNLNSLPINFGYAWLAAWASRRLALVQHALRWMDRAAGLLFIGFGAKLAATDSVTS
mgnify:FL=1